MKPQTLLTISFLIISLSLQAQDASLAFAETCDTPVLFPHSVAKVSNELPPSLPEVNILSVIVSEELIVELNY